MVQKNLRSLIRVFLYPRNGSKIEHSIFPKWGNNFLYGNYLYLSNST
jgi:hypothetical protein